MANEILIPTLAQALSGIGNAHIFIGDFFTADTMVALGQIAGPVSVQHDVTYNQLTAPELTGPMVHDETIDGENIVLTAPVLVPPDAASDFWASVSPLGTSSGGYSYPQTPVDTCVALVPDKEVGGGLKYAAATWTRLAGNGIAAGTGATVAPVNALFLPRARVSLGSWTFDRANGGRMTVPVTIQAKFANQVGVPEGAKLYTLGDPSAVYTGFLFSAPV